MSNLSQLETTTSPSIGTDTETTTTVETFTTGSIHGMPVEAFRIIAGSEFPVDETTHVRFSPGDVDDEIEFAVDIDPESIDVRPRDGTDVHIGGCYEEFFTPAHSSNIRRERVEVQTPIGAKRIFNEIQDEHNTDFHWGYTDHPVSRWNVTTEWIDTVIENVIKDGYSVVLRIETLRDLYTPHPEHTVNDSGKYIITSESQVDPDYYETDNPRPEAGHGKGGNPHDIRHHLKNGECPVEDCDACFDTFASLRSHIGGKATPNDTPEQNAHDRANLRLNEVTVETTISNE